MMNKNKTVDQDGILIEMFTASDGFHIAKIKVILKYYDRRDKAEELSRAIHGACLKKLGRT